MRVYLNGLYSIIFCFIMILYYESKKFIIHNINAYMGVLIYAAVYLEFFCVK
mgnify:CR=1 FL=1